jgi:hypothetical protein
VAIGIGEYQVAIEPVPNVVAVKQDAIRVAAHKLGFHEVRDGGFA